MRALLLIAWRNAVAGRGRTAMTVLAVMLGVSFLSGSLSVSDTLSRNLSALFSSQYESVDVVVRGEALTFGVRSDLDESLIADVRQVDGVEVAQGVVEGFAQPVDEEGLPIASGQQPGIGKTWLGDPRLQNLPLADGRGPESDAEVALDKATADRGDLAVGDTVSIATTVDTFPKTVVGIVDVSSGTGSPLSWFHPPTAQALLGSEGKVQEIFAAAAEGVTPDALVISISAVLPVEAEALTGQRAAEESQQAVEATFGFFQVILLVFVGIGLLVCLFIVFNTFAVLTAQRTRQLATLRAIGASRSQVSSSTLVEAAVLGVVGAVAGVLLGYGSTLLLTWVIKLLDLGDLSGGLVLSPVTIVLSLVAGIAVTVIGALPAARKSGKTPPVAAMRSATLGSDEVKFSWLMVGIFALSLSILVISAGSTIGYPEGMSTLAWGVLLLLVGVVTLGRPIVVGVVRGLVPLVGRIGGYVGTLAGRNATRDSRRTTVTAGSLALGLALVAALSVLTSSIKATLDDDVNESLTADLVVLPLVGFTPMPATVTEKVRNADGVGAASELLIDAGVVDKNFAFITGVDPVAAPQVMRLEMVSGDVAALERGELLVAETTAQTNRYSPGQDVRGIFPVGGLVDMRIGGVFEDNSYAGFYLLDAPQLAALTGNEGVWYLYANAEPGTDVATAQQSVMDALADEPNIQVLTLEEFLEWQDAIVDQFLAGVYFMLLFAVIVAVIGVANTIALSVSERSKEIGMMRAVGTQRGQVARMIRLEAVMTSLAGAVVGTVVGLILGIALQQALSSVGFEVLSVPIASIFGFLIFAALAGVVAAYIPARRSSRMHVLDAIRGG